jgi:hypothetical protein
VVNATLLGPVSPFQPAGPRIEPEQPREAEIGADVRWGSRLEINATYVDQRTPKLIAIGAPFPSLGVSTGITLANMENRGIEVGTRVDVIDGPTTRWTTSLGLATLRNRVTGFSSSLGLIGPGAHDGQPNGTVATMAYTFVDTNDDGLPAPSEFTPSGVRIAGNVIPTREASLRSELEMRRWGLTLAAALDHRGGHSAHDSIERYSCMIRQCRGWQDPDAPLADKIRAVQGSLGLAHLYAGYLKDASYTRLGELALAWKIPVRFGRVLANDLTMIIEGRNLATLTGFDGPDPEVATARGHMGGLPAVPMLPAVPRTVGVRVEWR